MVCVYGFVQQQQQQKKAPQKLLLISLDDICKTIYK